MNRISMARTKGLIGLSFSLTLCVQSVFGQAPVFFTNTFDSPPILAASQTAGAWYPDRFPPAIFEQYNLSGRNVLHVGIRLADAYANRPLANRNTFANTQGRKFTLGSGNGFSTALVADLFVDPSWQTSHRRAELWSTACDSTGADVFYNVFGFRNATGSDPGFYMNGLHNSGVWTLLPYPITYGNWYSLKIELTDTAFVYSINGTVVLSDTSLVGTKYFSNIMLQAYNFADSTLPASNQAFEEYDVYWDNVGAINTASTQTINLGTAATFGVLSAAGITGTGTMTGNIGTSTGSIGIGITATGTIYPVGDPAVTAAHADLRTAYDDAAGRSRAVTIPTELGSQTLTAGVYKSTAGTFGITGTLTLDAQNNPDAVFIFQTGSTLITAGGSGVILVNGAKGSNVFWQVGSSATLGASSVLEGTILANTSITLGNSATVHGRLLAGAVTSSGVVTLDAARGVDTHAITSTSGPNGSISPSGVVNVAYGINQTFTITPGTGYHVADVLVDGISVGAVISYTFTNVTANHTIAVSFAINTHTITATAGANGSISPSGVVTVNNGAGQSFTITPSTTYHVADVLVDGISVGATTNYTFTNVTANHTIAASFAINTYTITATVGANGSISPSGVVTLNSGAGQSFTVTPNTGYRVADVQVDGLSVGAVTSYIFFNVAANHTIAANFVINTYTLTYTAESNGSITGSTPQTVSYDTDGATVTAVPSTGYHFVSWSDASTNNPRTDLHVTANVSVTANFAINIYTITPAAGANGTVSPPTAVTAAYGGNATFTVTPSTGYHVADVLVDGASVGGVTSYTFTNITANHTIATSFAINAYAITATAGTNGSISPSGVLNVAHGLNQTFTITPGTGYHVADVLIDGISVGAVTSYSFSNVTTNHTVAASFAINAYAVTASAGLNGTITPTGGISVNYGANQSFTITPSTGYQVADVLVDGVTVGTVASYTFTNVTANHTISASFAIKTFTITASAGLNGTITPTGGISVNYGANQSFTITPSTGYHVADVLADSVSAGAVIGYMFTNVTASHTISAFFTINTPASPALVTPVDAAVNNLTSPTLSWNASTGAATYRLQVSSSNTFATTLYNDSTITGLSQPITGLTTGTTYYWRVNAKNAGGTSVYSTVWSFTTIVALPAAPVLVTPADAAVNTLIGPTLIWNASTGAVTYRLQVSTNNLFTTTVYNDSTITGTSQAITGLAPGTTYYWRVNAKNTGGTTTYSPVWSFTTVIPYVVTLSSSPVAGGTTSGGGTFSSGSSATVIATANAGHTFTNWTEGVTVVSATASYAFTIGGNRTLVANFQNIQHTITASAGPNGTITPTGGVSVNYGANQSFTITPTSGYHVSEVLVDGVSVGAVATYTFADVTANHVISASFAINAFTITASAGPVGTITPSGSVPANYGANQTFTITQSLGYHVADVLVDGVSVGAVASYTFPNVTANHTISATFAVTTFTITASAGANGAITPTGGVSVNYGANQSFTSTPSLGSHVTDVLVDGISVGAVASYMFTNVTANHTIAASFAINAYAITVTAGANGSISPSGVVDVIHGLNQTFTMTPGTGYHVADVLVDGISVGAVTSYSFSNVTADHAVAASFAVNAYSITATAGVNGSISSPGVASISYGSSHLLTITPGIGYHVADVLVDGTSVGAVTSYTFTNVTANHTIAASFALNTYTIAATAGANGSISPIGAITANYGANQSFPITPDTRYHVVDVLVDGISVGAVTSYTFTNVSANHTITASFAINTYTITSTSSANGSVSPNGTVLVECNSNYGYRMMPNTGNHLDSLLVDGVRVDSSTSYTFMNVTGNHTIRAVFGILSLVLEFDPTVPKAYVLFQNYPNPFNPSTKIQYSLQKAGTVSLKVYNVLGHEVAILVNAHQEAGTYIVSFSAGGESSPGGRGARLASGVYFYRLETGSFVSIKKLVLMK